MGGNKAKKRGRPEINGNGIFIHDSASTSCFKDKAYLPYFFSLGTHLSKTTPHPILAIQFTRSLEKGKKKKATKKNHAALSRNTNHMSTQTSRDPLLHCQSAHCFPRLLRTQNSSGKKKNPKPFQPSILPMTPKPPTDQLPLLSGLTRPVADLNLSHPFFPLGISLDFG